MKMRRLRRSHLRRQNWRQPLGIATMTLIAMVAGRALGMRSLPPAEQFTVAVQSERASADLTKEAVRIIINELWRMENLERLPGVRR